MLLPLNLGQRLPRFRRTGGILLLAGLVGIAGVASSADFGTASAEQAAYVGVAVPAGLVDVIAQASLSCPSLTAPRVAGQIMAESGFQNGAGGLAGLTGQQWEQWKPWPDAAQTDAAANVTALAHRMCDLAGQVRNTQIDGDAWMLALAAYDIGMPTVVGAKAVPSAAEGYVTAVTGYTAWYVAQADTVVMPSASVPAPVVAPGGSAPGKIPDAYVDLIVKAGGTCPQIGAAELAGQLMAASAFNPDLLGADGSQGIAQFLPSVWQRYAKAGESPWEPADAIGVLARTMCALTSNLRGITADPYPSALAAYHWGATTLERPGDMPDSAAVKAYADRVIAYAAYYAQDARLDDGERTGTKTATTASAPGKSAVPKPSGAVTKS
ncbi:MAG TPA: hypothetical protein VN408_29285, partial [Actinoplanes sp.]|nr:hypothetical protein [Actinoplanes sp.]